MKLKLLIASLFSMIAIITSTSHALEVNGGTVNFKGEFVNAACAVSTESDNQVVQLGQYRTAPYTAKDQTTTSVPFKIKLVDCAPVTGQTTASISFNGISDSINSDLLAVNSGTNEPSATGVGIEILDYSGKPLAINSGNFSPEVTLIEGTNELNFLSRYKTTATAVTPGRADGVATFRVNYQ